MLKLYYGRENIDKERVMFDEIAATLPLIGQNSGIERIIMLVPDQYTLQAERNAIFGLKVRGLMDLEVLSMNRLAGKVLDETGGSTRVHIDKHGRHMLLSKIISDEDDNLQVFRGLSQSHSFIDMTNNLISEMKQYNTGLSDLKAIMEGMEADTLLHRKLSDIYRIYEKYEEQIEDKYIDTEDYINLFISQIGRSSVVNGTVFWVSGFDYFTPKSIKVIAELIKYGKDVNIVLTEDGSSRDKELFGITRRIGEKIKQAAGEYRIAEYFLTEPVTVRNKALEHLERELFAYPYEEYKGGRDAVTFCRAANYYSEAETAAVYILRLVREKGLRFRDIAVICNDMEGRGSIIKRVFDEYGISYFLDQKRSILHNPAVVFISALLDTVTEGWLYEDVFRLLKTGFCPVDQEDWERLENYAIRYRIQGKRWNKDFQYGKSEFGEEEVVRLNEVRKTLAGFIGEFSVEFNKAQTVREKTAALYSFLKDTADLPGQLEKLTESLTDEVEYDAASETAQVWENVLGLFDQLIELIGEKEISDADYAAMLAAGFESVEVGLIPSTIDQVVVGTMQRTRVGKIKALVIIGANDGVLPAAPSGDDLLSQDERALLLNRNIEICKDDDLRIMEERLAIYRNLAKPERYLWAGFSASDHEGKEIRPSIIFDKLRRLFPDIPLNKDIRNTDDPFALIERPKSSLKYMTEALRKANAGEDELTPEWKAVYNWYHNRGDENLDMLLRGITFNNRLEKLEADLVKKLYQKRNTDELTLSPSRLEKFSRCPFAHLVLYGLAPEERRVFEIAGREAGDVYHECLMRFAESLSVQGIEITDENSPWMQLTGEDCRKKTDELIDRIAAEYKEGMLVSGQEEKYRTSRMKEVCAKAAWALVEHVQHGRIKEVFFEKTFGKRNDKALPPIQVKIGDQTVSIEGKIDRIDVLPGGYVKVIDYKSGKEHFDINEAKGGWKLQLMLYLRAAMQGLGNENEPVKPAGVFYFEIADPLIDATSIDIETLHQKIETEIRRAFKLDGIVLNEPEVIEGIAGDFTGFSEIIPVRRNKDGGYSGTTESKLLELEDFKALQDAVDKTIYDLCSSLASGVIDIRPKKTRYETACKYCEYKSICNFELSFDGCSYDVVK